METNTKAVFLKSALQKALIICIQKSITVYKIVISPFLGNRCRFSPTCSEYAHQAIEQYGVIKGTLLSLKRISRCHPWGTTGYDPVPEFNKQTAIKEVNN